jgi:PAS domain S-box-containing protein
MLNARETTTQIYSKLDNIMSQLVPNGGTSIRDSLNRIEDKQHFLGAFIKTQMNTGDKALFQTDEHGDYIWVNRPHSRLTGYQAGEVMGDGWINLIAPECRIHTMELWLSAVKALREFNETLWFIKTDNKTRYLVRVHAYTIDQRDGTVAGYLGEVTPLGQEESKPVNCNVFRSMAGPTV